MTMTKEDYVKLFEENPKIKVYGQIRLLNNLEGMEADDTKIYNPIDSVFGTDARDENNNRIETYKISKRGGYSELFGKECPFNRYDIMMDVPRKNGSIGHESTEWLYNNLKEYVEHIDLYYEFTEGKDKGVVVHDTYYRGVDDAINREKGHIGFVKDTDTLKIPFKAHKEAEYIVSEEEEEDNDERDDR